MNFTKDKENIVYVQEILKEYPRRNNVIRKLELDIEELKLNISGGLRGIDYSRDIVQTSNISSSVENEILKMEKDIEDIKEQIEKKKIHFERVQLALATLTEIQRKIIEYRHFKSFTWGTVEKYIGYTDRQCMNINNDIISLLISHYKIKPSN